MRSIVIDASVLIKVYIYEKDTSLALTVLEREGLNLEAPDIIAAEVVNTLVKHERRGLLPAWIVDRAVRDLVLLIPRLVPSSNVLMEAITTARLMRHPLFDCIYLALAEKLGLDFVTADEEFADRCRARIPARAKRVVLLREFAV